MPDASQADPFRRLAGRRVLVTGATGGMGAAVVERLAAEGARLGVTDLRGEQLDELVARLRACGADVVAATADVRREDEVAAAVEAVSDAFGALDVLYNNAGVLTQHDAPVDALDVEVWDDLFAINARGQFLFCKHAVPALLAGDRPLIVNVSSVAGYAGNPTYHAYAASKAASIGLTRSIAQGYGPRGLRAVALCPGFVETPMVESWTSDPVATADVVGRTALRRFGHPTEIAATAAFLASTDSSFVTSAIVPVHGGLIQ